MTTILPRRGTAAEWTAANPVLAMGELGFETDTTRWKRGDGVTAWNALAYYQPAWGDITSKPSVIAAGADQAAARAAIGAADLTSVNGKLDKISTADRVYGTNSSGGQTTYATYYLNILDFGVTRGTTASQTVAIKTALDANPGKAFFFPPGEYRLDTQLNITAGNSIILAAGARIYAGASMTTLINYDNGATAVDNYAENKCLIGYGELSGNLLANNVLRIASVLRFSVDGLTIVDGINRGLLADTLGAELHVTDIRVKNTTTSNVTDNVGIEVRMNDARFSNISMRDLTVGVWDKGSNYWFDIHPWLGTTAQLTARYQNSVAFLLQGNSVMESPYADTYRYSFRTQADTGYVRARINHPEVYANPGNLTDALAAAYPGVVLDITDTGSSLIFNNGLLRGHPTTPHVFTQGNTSRLNARENIAPGVITGIAEYRRGAKIEKSPFTPSVYGSSVSGSQTYNSRSGYVSVEDGFVTYTFSMDGTFGSGITGNLRIGGLPMVSGAISVNFGWGDLNVAKGIGAARSIIGANGTSTPLTAVVIDLNGTEVSSSGMASTAFLIRGSIRCPFDYASTLL